MEAELRNKHTASCNQQVPLLRPLMLVSWYSRNHPHCCTRFRSVVDIIAVPVFSSSRLYKFSHIKIRSAPPQKPTLTICGLLGDTRLYAMASTLSFLHGNAAPTDTMESPPLQRCSNLRSRRLRSALWTVSW